MADRPSRQEPVGMGFAGGRAGFGNATRWMQGGGEKPKNIRETLMRLWGYFGGERRLFYVVFLIVLLSSGVGLAVPYLIGRAVDAVDVLRSFNLRTVVVFVLPLGLAYFCDAVLNFGNNFLMAGISQRIVKRLRLALFSKLQSLPVSFFDSNTHGELMSRLTNDIDNVSTTISQSTTQLMSSLVMIAGSLTMMVILSPPLTAASMITVPLVFLLTRTIAKRTRVLFREQQRILGRLNGSIEESISGLDIVKAFAKEGAVAREFGTHSEALCRVGIRAQIWAGYLMPLMNVINNIGFAAVACVGGVLAIEGSITTGVIASFLSYSRQFTRPLNDIANTFNTLQTAVAGAERVFEVLDEPEECEDGGDAVVPEGIRGDVDFQGVSFGYSAHSLGDRSKRCSTRMPESICCGSRPPAPQHIDSPRGTEPFWSSLLGGRSRPTASQHTDSPTGIRPLPSCPLVLNEVSFRVAAGSHIALVGPTGAGKTTIISLLTRFYDVTEGSILIDGRDIRGYKRAALRGLFGIVLQDTYLFSGTIKENIRYGRPGATDAEVKAAAVVSNADPFIRRLPKGYDTQLIESGSNLSQGQRQLLSIARVVLADPSILILDEATSSVDTRTELHIQEAMLKLMEGRTSFVIAHRLSTIRDADRILVVDHGRIVEEGNHDELIRLGGVYRDMYQSQFANTPMESVSSIGEKHLGTF